MSFLAVLMAFLCSERNQWLQCLSSASLRVIIISRLKVWAKIKGMVLLN